MTTKSTQEFVPIKEVRDGIVILKSGGMRAILMTSSLNFALKSVEEQEAILFQFQNFLNSLDFSVQIFIQSRNLDIRSYIATLEEQYKTQITELMRIQIREYIEFIKNFIENANIMTKSFFVVIPYSPPVFQGRKGILASLTGGKSRNSAKKRSENFEENRTQIEQRIAVVEQGLMSVGIRSIRLGTEEVIELLYKMFNPGEMEKPIPLNNS